MKALVGVATFGLMAAILTGCEGGWQFGGSAQNYNVGDWKDVSGVYIGTAGKYLVSNYTGIGAVSSNTVQETVGSTVGGQTVYSGSLSKTPVTAGTFSISIAGIASGHSSAAGAITGTGLAATGSTVDFNTGFWTITLSAAPAAGGVDIVATYNAPGSNSSGAGSSGVTISAFTIQQSGNQLIVTDNNGSVYKGTIGATSPASTNATYATYGYDVSGVSAAGFNVEMVGTFYTSSTNSAMSGTWLEQGGKTGNIDGNRQY